MCVIYEVIECLPPNKLQAVREGILYRYTKEIFEDGYLFYFVGAIGVAMFAHYISPAILIYILLIFYVAFYKLPLIHKKEHLKKGFSECALLFIVGLYLLLSIFEISF